MVQRIELPGDKIRSYLIVIEEHIAALPSGPEKTSLLEAVNTLSQYYFRH